MTNDRNACYSSDEIPIVDVLILLPFDVDRSLSTDKTANLINCDIGYLQFRPTCVSSCSVLLVWPFVDHTVGSFLLVSSVCCSKSGVIYSLVFLVVFSTRVFSVISRFSVACVAGVIRFLGCLVFFFQWLRCLVLSVARVSGVCCCSCVKPFQLLVRLAFSVARESSFLGCSCV